MTFVMPTTRGISLLKSRKPRLYFPYHIYVVRGYWGGQKAKFALCDGFPLLTGAKRKDASRGASTALRGTCQNASLARLKGRTR